MNGKKRRRWENLGNGEWILGLALGWSSGAALCAWQGYVDSSKALIFPWIVVADLLALAYAVCWLFSEKALCDQCYGRLQAEQAEEPAAEIQEGGADVQPEIAP